MPGFGKMQLHLPSVPDNSIPETLVSLDLCFLLLSSLILFIPSSLLPSSLITNVQLSGRVWMLWGWRNTLLFDWQHTPVVSNQNEHGKIPMLILFGISSEFVALRTQPFTRWVSANDDWWLFQGFANYQMVWWDYL